MNLVLNPEIKESKKLLDIILSEAAKLKKSLSTAQTNEDKYQHGHLQQ